MAVSRMRKLELLAHKSAKSEVIAALRESGVLHITEPSARPESETTTAERREREHALSSRLSKLEYIRQFLKPHAPKKKPLESMFNPKLLLSPEEVRSTIEEFDVDEWYERCLDLEGRTRSAEAEIGRKESLAAELEHWSGLGEAIEQISDTRLARVALLSVEPGEFDGLASDLDEAVRESDLVEVSRGSSAVYAVAFFVRESEPAATQLLKRHNARSVDLGAARGRPAEAAAGLLDEAAALRVSIEALRAETGEAAVAYERVLVVLDETAEELARTTVEERFAETRDTFLLEGWIRSRDEAALRERLGEVSSETYLATRDPERGEDVPIDLSNNPLVRPFEFVTTLYGRPVYWEYDPTPLLAPFFIIYFGLCVSDAGYGLVVAALTFVFMRKMQPGGGRTLMKLLFMGGISTAVIGALTGGWFGIHPESMHDWLREIVVVSPLQEPMKMLNVVFLIGIVQIFTGLAIRMVEDFRDGRWLDGILDQLVWIGFLTSLVPLGYSFILGGHVSEPVMNLAKRGALIFGLLVVATGARKNANPVMKVLGGVLKLYDIVGYFGDVLSYARLLALGLATGAIAMAINGVAGMALGLKIAGPVAALIVLLGGHFFNIAVNCLGGFVHSGRLQYLEYFSKFFHGGGRAFEPFRERKRYSIVRRESGA